MSEIARSWYVLHVRPRTEKKVAAYMGFWRCWHYLPLCRRTRRVQRRTGVTETPLFPGYVFARLDPYERAQVRKSNMIVRFISVERPRELIHQLRQIAHAGRAEPELRTVGLFKEGDLVRVTQGPFYGIEGYIRRDAGGSRIVLNLEILGQAVEVSIAPSECERVDIRTADDAGKEQGEAR